MSKRIKPVLAILFLVGLAAGALAAERPNVVIFLADDLGWADVGFHGGPIDTPSIDRLAREGAELSRFYATPICSPTRAALMTGRDPIKLGVAYATLDPWDNHGVHPEERFMAEAFKQAGYQTAILGKWHLGHAQQPGALARLEPGAEPEGVVEVAVRRRRCEAAPGCAFGSPRRRGDRRPPSPCPRGAGRPPSRRR